jgi:small subunit ribosomal protein S21
MTSLSKPMRVQSMPGVVVDENESFENAIRRFKKQLQKSGVLGEAKKRRAYDKPSVKKKKKSLLARKRLLKKMRRMARVRRG